MANSDNEAKTQCAHCGAQSSDPHFCSECKKIQPLRAGGDYFAFFGLPRRLRLDEAELEKSFYRLSRQFHPDYFMTSTPAERQASVERTSMLNDAYRILRNRTSRAQYLLQLQGYKEAEKKAPPDLLEEVFELNMQVEGLKAAKKLGDEDEINDARTELAQALRGLEERLAALDAQLYMLFGEWDDAAERADEARRAVLDRMSELLSHRSYVRNLVRDIKEEI